MKLSENFQIISNLNMILKYYEYLEYDNGFSKKTDRLCVNVSNQNIENYVEILDDICLRLGDEFICEFDKPTRFFIRIKNDDDDYDYYNSMMIPLTNEELGPEPDSAIAYYYRGYLKLYMGQYEEAITDYKKAHSEIKENQYSSDELSIRLSLISAENKKCKIERNQFYRKYHGSFLEREEKRIEIIKRYETIEWKDKQKRVLDRDGELCACGDIATEVHHKTYDNIGNELLSDLVALCKYCYNGVHSGVNIKLCKVLNSMNKKDYNEYLDTDEWKYKRNKVIKRDNSLCLCGEKSTVVHHKTYINVSQEKLSDLVSLCKNCHDGYHGRLSVSSDIFWNMRID